jgi:hypothetical protein
MTIFSDCDDGEAPSQHYSPPAYCGCGNEVTPQNRRYRGSSTLGGKVKIYCSQQCVSDAQAHMDKALVRRVTTHQRPHGQGLFVEYARITWVDEDDEVVETALMRLPQARIDIGPQATHPLVGRTVAEAVRECGGVYVLYRSTVETAYRRPDNGRIICHMPSA